MKKTMLALLIVLLLVPTGLFAGIFNLSLGVTAQYKNPLPLAEEIEEGFFEGMAELDNWAFGGDIRMRLLFVELDVAALYSKLDNGHLISGLVTAGVSFDLFGFLRLGLGMGPRIGVSIDDDGETTILGPDGGVIDENTEFGEAFMKALMTYRLTADFKLGSFLVGLNYTVDSDGFTFDNLDVDKLVPNFKQGAVGVSFLYSFF
jgi:hypothetical protein